MVWDVQLQSESSFALLGVVAVGFVITIVLTTILRFVLRFIAHKRKLRFADCKYNRTEIFAIISVACLLTYFTIPQLVIVSQAITVLLQIILTVTTLSIGGVVLGIIRIIIELAIRPLVKSTKTKVDDQILSLANRFATILIWLLTFVYILTVWDVEIAPLLASLGIAGLAVALALQPALANVFSGIALFMDKTFTLGDIITFNDTTAVVHDLGLRSTRLKTFDNEIIVVPNTLLADSVIQNRNKPDKSLRVNVEFGVEYGVDPEFVKVIVLEELESIEYRLREKEPTIIFSSMGDSALLFKAMIWVPDISLKFTAHQEAMTKIYRRLYKEDIGIPFPQQTVWLRDEGKARSPSPFGRKFSKTSNRIFADWGREFVYAPKEFKEEKDVRDELLSKATARTKKLFQKRHQRGLDE